MNIFTKLTRIMCVETILINFKNFMNSNLESENYISLKFINLENIKIYQNLQVFSTISLKWSTQERLHIYLKL